MNEVILSGIGLLLAIAVLVILAFKQVNLIIVGLAASIVCAVFSGQNLYEALMVTYMSGFTSFFGKMFLLFLASASLGAVYQNTGAARAIGILIGRLFGPKRALTAIVVTTAILTYGGISCFIVVFAVYPVALVLLEQGDITNKLSAGAIAAGCWTFAMTGPFSTQVVNIIPGTFLGTGPAAGGVMGIAVAAGMAILCCLYLEREGKKARLAGEHFAFPSHVERFDESKELPNVVVALIPLVFLMVVYNAFGLAIEICMYATLALSLILFWKHLPKGQCMNIISKGCVDGVMFLINMCAVIAFGSISKATPFYAWAVETVLNSDLSPYILSWVGSNVFAGLLGSASGGISLIFSSLGDVFLSWGQQGYDLGLIHRLASVGCGGLDSLPFCGGVCSMLTICGLSHKDGYKYIGITCTLIPLIVGLVIGLPLAMLLG